MESDSVKVWQPFREGICKLRSKSCNAITYRYEEPYIVIEAAHPHQCMSNAVWNGGVIEAATHFINYRVPLSYESDEPLVEYKELLQDRELTPQHTIGLMTAAKLSHAAIAEYSCDRFAMSVIATAGTSNAARAGVARNTYCGYIAGTINIFVFIDARVKQSAIVNAFMTATEAKSAALADLKIVEQSNGLIATGTTTDALVIAVSQQAGYTDEYIYAGTATDLGCKLAELVYSAVYECVRTQAHTSFEQS